MTADNAENKETSKSYGLKDMGVDVATLTASHPLALVKNSIQLGHRPLDDYTARSWLPWKTSTFRPGFLPHAKHILDANGLGGLWKGWLPRVSSCLLFNITKPLIQKQADNFFPLEDNEVNVNKDEVDEIFIKVGKKCVKQSFVDCLAIALQYPLHLMAIRSMASICNGEDAYDTLLSSFLEIKDNEGWGGFFKGLSVKLIGTVIGVWLVETCSVGIKKLVAVARENADEESIDSSSKSEWSSMMSNLDKHSGKVAAMCTSSLIYPYSLVSTVMALQGSRLNMSTDYKTWNDCMAYLKANKEHTRGSSILFGRKIKQASNVERAVAMAAFALEMRTRQ